jgi:hypothetical protein
MRTLDPTAALDKSRQNPTPARVHFRNPSPPPPPTVPNFQTNPPPLSHLPPARCQRAPKPFQPVPTRRNAHAGAKRTQTPQPGATACNRMQPHATVPASAKRTHLATPRSCPSWFTAPSDPAQFPRHPACK